MNQAWVYDAKAPYAACSFRCNAGYSYSSSSKTCIANSCATRPNIIHATFITGALVTTPNQAWKINTSTPSPSSCYYTCTNGYSGNQCQTIPVPTWTQTGSL